MNLIKHKSIFISAFICFLTTSVIAQEIDVETVSEKRKPFPKHEIGFSVGAFPFVGLGEVTATMELFRTLEGNRWGHWYDIRDGKNFEKMYHFGSYTFNYNYHIDLKSSIGASFSWTGKHIEQYWVYHPNDIVDGSGWKHYYTLQANYRRTYYRKEDTSLYWGVHYGFTYAVRDRSILTKEPRIFWKGHATTDVRTYFQEDLHLSIFGIETETGEKNVFNIEFGLGTQGILKVGYKHKFNIK